jgi:transcriptional regulator with GAF, ATPase, and Fis domain
MILLSEEGPNYRIAYARGIDPEGEEARTSQTVARQAAATGRPVVLANSHLDGQALDAPSIEASEARSILCAPLLDGEEVLGVVYLDGKASERLFGDRDLKLFSTLALHVGSALVAQKRRREVETRARNLGVLQRRTAVDEGRDPQGLVACSGSMQEIRQQLKAVACRDTTTLLLGESGTGKELLARAIHDLSPRREGPFVPVNCMALVSGLAASELFGHEKGAFTGAEQTRTGRFELADGGTLFLDEVGELSAEMQVRLLRVLQERRLERVGGNREISIDVRVVAATNRDMKQAITSGEFREDLWYRLNVFTIQVPPLRERPEDVPALVEHFVEHFRGRFGSSLEGPDVDLMKLLQSYPWPGNVRELRNVVERAFVLEQGPRISLASLPPDLTGEGLEGKRRVLRVGELTQERNFRRAKEEFEQWFLTRALQEHQGNMTAAAEEAGIPRKTIYRKLKSFGVSVEDLLRGA